MPLPPPAPRQPRHRRQLEMHGYLREDGQWDIEGHLVDTKAYDFDNAWRGKVEAGTPVHEMWIRLTVDETLLITAVDAAIDAGPHRQCPAIAPSYGALVGERIKPGWNRLVRKLFGGVRGCTHLMEMLGPMGTVAYQTVGPSRAVASQDGAEGTPRRRPARIDGCHVFASDGEQVRQRWPEFYTGKS